MGIPNDLTKCSSPRLSAISGIETVSRSARSTVHKTSDVLPSIFRRNTRRKSSKRAIRAKRWLLPIIGEYSFRLAQLRRSKAAKEELAMRRVSVERQSIREIIKSKCSVELTCTRQRDDIIRTSIHRMASKRWEYWKIYMGSPR